MAVDISDGMAKLTTGDASPEPILIKENEKQPSELHLF